MIFIINYYLLTLCVFLQANLLPQLLEQHTVPLMIFDSSTYTNDRYNEIIKFADDYLDETLRDCVQK